MTTRQIGLTTFGALLAARMLAQGPSVEMRVDRLATELGLSDAQKVKATAIYNDAATAGVSIQGSLRDNRESLADAVKKNDTAAITALSTTAGMLIGQLLAVNTKADAAFYAILTADQQAKYDTLPHGPGGPGGGPIGPEGFGGPRQ
jgi:Spy/CpxP family protein refolding chaperone